VRLIELLERQQATGEAYERDRRVHERARRL
jgi:hypothetical protein